jgi:hypothetical protein
MQGELDFACGNTEGFTKWMQARQMAAHELAQRIGLPLGHEVEVWLRGSVRLRGRLRLSEEVLFLTEEQSRHIRLVVDGVPFSLGEMESCVRTD